MLKRETKLKPEQAAKIIYQTAMGLTTAHDKGVIHRDIKPGNLMVSARGSVKIADFGIALSAQDFSKKLTSTGEFVGTPGYLSPEVCQGKPVDQRSDIFSLGIVLFECLAGRMPFTDESPLGLMLEVVKAEIPNVMSLNSEVDPELSRILQKMVAKDPADRYQSCHELVEDLGRHPLVAKGGPITLQTKMSPAAATMVGQKTPVSGQQSLPRTSPTPRPAVVPMPAPSAHQPVLQQPVEHRVAFGFGVAVRDRRDPVARLRRRRVRVPRSHSVPAAISRFVDDGEHNDCAVTTTTTGDDRQRTTTTAVASTTTRRDAAPPRRQRNRPAPDANAARRKPRACNPRNRRPTHRPRSRNNSRPMTNAGGPAARASEVQPLRELAAAQAAEAQPQQPQQVARVTPPPPPAPPRPHIPTIAVIGGGDNNIAEPAERMIVQALSRRGFNVLDEASMPHVGHLFAGERPRYDEVLDTLAKQGRVDAVVFVHARDVGAEQLAAYGQVSNVVTAQLRVKAYSVDQRRPLGSDWSDAVHFSSLNAADQTDETVKPWLEEIEQALQAYRPHRDRG